MEKRVYIKPEVELIFAHAEQLLVGVSPAGGHGGGNPGDTPAEPAKFHLVGYDVFGQDDNDGWQNGSDDSDNGSESLW